MKKLDPAASATLAFVLASIALIVQPSRALAMRGGQERLTQAERMEMQRDSAPEIVKWIGTVEDDADSHTTEHAHELEFTRKDNGESYDIVDSPELVKLHHETEKNYVVEIDAEKTPKFLFWGGNLIVRNFKVIAEVGDRIPHGALPARSSSSERNFSGGHRP